MTTMHYISDVGFSVTAEDKNGSTAIVGFPMRSHWRTDRVQSGLFCWPQTHVQTHGSGKGVASVVQRQNKHQQVSNSPRWWG